MLKSLISGRKPVFRPKILLAGLAALAGIIVVAVNVAQPPAVEAEEPKAANGQLAALMTPGPLPEKSLGAENAPVTIIEYSSMTCPHCASFHNDTLPQLKEKYIDTGKVRYVIREFPLDNLAAGAAMLARCVEGDKYFAFVDLLYAKQSDWAADSQSAVAKLQELAKQAGITGDRFNQCLGDQKVLSGIQEIRDRASTEFGVRSTPSFFINGKLLKGAQELEKFEELMAEDLG